MVRMLNLSDQNDPKRGDDTSKCVVQSAVALCETSPLFEPASQRVLCVAGEVRSTSTEIHVIETEGSGTNPSESGLGKGKAECETHTRESLSDGQSISVERSLPPVFRRHADAVDWSCFAGRGVMVLRDARTRVLCSSRVALVFPELHVFVCPDSVVT